MLKNILLTLLALAAFNPLHAQADTTTPRGLWKNIDDHSGKSKALIRISEQNGELQGKIEKIFPDADAEPNPVCNKCEGALKDQPILGMTIMHGFKLSGAEYNGGTILDPDNGKVYKCKLSIEDNGKKLLVRGYIGIPLFGRSQIWLREE